MNPSTCFYVYKAHCLANWMMTKGTILSAIAGMIVNFSMSYCYVSALQAGRKEEQRRKLHGGKTMSKL